MSFNIEILEELKKPLALAKPDSNVTADVFKKLLENSFSYLITKQKVHNVSNLYNSKPDVIKELYATLMRSCAEFAKNNFTRDQIYQYLLNDCGYSSQKATIFADLYEENRIKMRIQLGDIGNHLPHIVDVKWSIDYIIKSSCLDQTDGPIFRITLLTEVYDNNTEQKKLEEIKFTCTSQELQALIYKLKDAERHCHRIGQEH